MAVAGGSSLALASAAAASFPGRDGNIAFASNRSGLFDLYAMTPSGHLVKQLTRTRAVHELQPAWSADGRRIAFTRRSFADENHPGPFEIWVMNANGSHPHRLARGTEPAWSPDGRRIAFTGSSTPRVSHPDIWVMRSDGSHLRRLTFNRLATDRSPDWSPDGRQIAFVTNRGFHGTRAIYVMHPDGHQKLRLTPTGVRTDSPSWSPDGRQIVFVRWPPQTPLGLPSPATLWTMKPDGSDERTLGDHAATTCAWAPTGDRIACSAPQGATGQGDDLFVVSSDASAFTKLTSSPANEIDPAWQPRPPR